MTSATAGKPTVAPLTTLEDRTLRPQRAPDPHWRWPGLRPTTNKEQGRLAPNQRQSVPAIRGTSGPWDEWR